MGSTGAEGYRERLDREQARYHRAIRRTRRHAWNNPSLSELDRVVFGLTGSVDVLAKYKEIAEDVSQRQGEPLIKPTRIDGHRVLNAYGGLIAGELMLTSSFIGSRVGTGVGECTLSVPVEPVVSVFRFSGLEVVTGDEVGLDSIEVGTIKTHEHGDDTDPSKDFTDHTIEPALIGRHAIYHSMNSLDGIDDVLEAIEAVSS